MQGEFGAGSPIGPSNAEREKQETGAQTRGRGRSELPIDNWRLKARKVQVSGAGFQVSGDRGLIAECWEHQGAGVAGV